jgi:hypothetical protein
MRTRGISFGLGVLALLLVGASVDAQSDDVAEGKALYLDNGRSSPTCRGRGRPASD